MSGDPPNVVDMFSRRLGHCPLCERPISINDEHVRLGKFVLHALCARTPRAYGSQPRREDPTAS